MVNFISNLIGNNYIATLIVSLFPLIELKGGIVYAVGSGIDYFISFLIAYFGSSLAFFGIFFLFIPILNLLKKIKFLNSFANKIENYFKNKAEDTIKKRQEKNKKGNFSEDLLKIISVFVFVAIPLPMTGVWTGTAVAVFLNLKFKQAVLPVVIGNFIAGLLIILLTYICNLININLDYVLYALLILAIILFIIVLVKVLNKPVNDGKD